MRDVEGASFVPLVFSPTGGMGPARATTFKRLADPLSKRLDCRRPYAAMLNWLLSIANKMVSAPQVRGISGWLAGVFDHPAKRGRGTILFAIESTMFVKKKTLCRDWSSELCCSRKKVVEPMGKTSLVLDMVDVQEHDSG